MKNFQRPDQNHLLAALTPEALRRVSAQLEPIELRLGAVLYDCGEQLQYAYFPTSAIVSLQYLLESGASAEAVGIGSEGMVGATLCMGGQIMTNSAVILGAGYAYRLKRFDLQREFERAGSLQRVVLRHACSSAAQTFQIAACNRHHAVTQQLCRWLLLTLDRLRSNQLTMTQELLAGVLGARRESITLIAGELQRAGAIKYRRGHIEVLDRGALETRACECYGVISRELDQLRCAVDHCAGTSTVVTLPLPDLRARRGTDAHRIAR